MSLERGVCSCAELQVFSCYRGSKKACQAMHAISTTWKHELSSSFFPARQGAKGNSCHSDRNIRGTTTFVCHCQKLGGPVFLHDNAPAHQALATQKKLAYLGFQCLDQPPYSSDLTPWTTTCSLD